MPEKSELCSIEEYEKWLCRMQISRSTVNTYVREAHRLVDYLKGKRAHKDTVEQYKEYLLSCYKPASANLYLMACRKYLSYCGMASEELPKPVRVQKGQSVENVINLNEYRKMLYYAKEHGRRKDYLIMRALACTGIRVSELACITVHILADGKTVVYNKKKYREVYLPEKLVSELQDYCRENALTDGPVFLGSHGTCIDRRSVWEMLQKLADNCGIEKNKAHPHGFRHLFAQLYMEQYGNLPELADILGHSNIETTRRYTMSSTEEKRQKMEKLPL